LLVENGGHRCRILTASVTEIAGRVTACFQSEKRSVYEDTYAARIHWSSNGL
jgi:hypothetical protein